MKLAIIDLNSNTVVGTANDGYPAAEHQLLLPLPDEFSPEQAADWLYDGQSLRLDATLALLRAKTARKARIQDEAAALLGAVNQRLNQASEREAAGLATAAEVATVLAEREAVRQASDAAEAAVDALTDVLSVQSFVWPAAPAEEAGA
jgi:hypothetical protein